MTNEKKTCPIRWLRVDGTTVSCTESVKVLNENWEEARDVLQTMYEDAVLLGVGKEAYKQALHNLVNSLVCDYKEKEAPIESH
jgi:hypothetical protein